MHTCTIPINIYSSMFVTGSCDYERAPWPPVLHEMSGQRLLRDQTPHLFFSRFQNDIEVHHHSRPIPLETLSRKHSSSKAHDPRKCRLGFRGGCPELEKACRPPTLKERVLSRAFSEELESLVHAGRRLSFDPRGHLIHLWNKVFLAACLVSLFVDPLFLYLTGTQRDMCIEFKYSLALTLSMIRSLLDLFYGAHILFRFRTAFIAPSSRVFGRGELVIQPYKIARRYLGRTFWFDLVTALPLPQFVIWIVMPRLHESPTANRTNILRFSIIFQYLPRLFQIFPLSRQIVMATGVMTETAWAGAAYNLILYMLASHVLGALWYLFSVQRQESCWREACLLEGPACQTTFFDCNTVSSNRTIWYKVSKHHEPVHRRQRLLPVRHLRRGGGRQAHVRVLCAEVLLLLLVGAQEPELLGSESVDELVHR
ncbi:hypothetical protein BS78_K321400 [Paspalum vaginatum]|uniref:Ion transport domain-containing protein n=1 Tax=Paspalum vaginatum TaxID=158149 RepID=A0A9W7XAN0_9POAL|nr:hypothetical protein BS78_K321400 [Paspalum vaginatum]